MVGIVIGRLGGIVGLGLGLGVGIGKGLCPPFDPGFDFGSGRVEPVLVFFAVGSDFATGWETGCDPVCDTGTDVGVGTTTVCWLGVERETVLSVPGDGTVVGGGT